MYIHYVDIISIDTVSFIWFLTDHQPKSHFLGCLCIEYSWLLFNNNNFIKTNYVGLQIYTESIKLPQKIYKIKIVRE